MPTKSYFGDIYIYIIDFIFYNVEPAWLSQLAYLVHGSCYNTVSKLTQRDDKYSIKFDWLVNSSFDVVSTLNYLDDKCPLCQFSRPYCCASQRVILVFYITHQIKTKFDRCPRFGVLNNTGYFKLHSPGPSPIHCRLSLTNFRWIH